MKNADAVLASLGQSPPGDDRRVAANRSRPEIPDDDERGPEREPPRRQPLPLSHQQLIGRGLRRIFDEVVEEGIPDRFVQLLNEIDRKRDAGKGGE